jgi:hypothetical protein
MFLTNGLFFQKMQLNFVKTIQMRKFNINDFIYIQITEVGWKHLKETVGDEYIKCCIENRKEEVLNEVWYRLQFHEVSRLLLTSHTTALLFETDIMFDE